MVNWVRRCLGFTIIYELDKELLKDSDIILLWNLDEFNHEVKWEDWAVSHGHRCCLWALAEVREC